MPGNTAMMFIPACITACLFAGVHAHKYTQSYIDCVYVKSLWVQDLTINILFLEFLYFTLHYKDKIVKIAAWWVLLCIQKQFFCGTIKLKPLTDDPSHIPLNL